MRRVASLYLPFLPTDRIRQARPRSATRPEPQFGNAPKEDSQPGNGHWRPGAVHSVFLHGR